jgi:hypothetical protein
MKSMYRICLPVVCFTSALAQTPAAIPSDLRGYQDLLRNAQSASTANDRKDAVSDLLDLGGHTRLFLEYVATKRSAAAAFNQIAKQLASARIDQQQGSGASAGGSVSAVERAGITSVLSLAVDSGSITQAISGTTATINGNLDSVTRVLLGREAFPYCPPGRTTCGTPVLKDIAFSASFDLSRGGTKSVTTSGANSTGAANQSLDILNARQQLSGATVKYVFSNPQDVRSKTFQTQWNDFYSSHRDEFQKAGGNLAQSIGNAMDPLLKSSKSIDLQTTYVQKLTAALSAGQDIVPLFRGFLDAEIALAKSVAPDFDSQVQTAIQGYMQYFANIRPLIASIVTKPVFSAEYDYLRPASQPDMHHFAILSTFSPMGPTGSMTLNIAGTAYANGTDSRNYGRWRDFQASLQLERKLGDIVSHPATFSLAGYYQYMLTPGLLKITTGTVAPGTNIDLGQNAAVALAPKGSIWIAEAKLTVKIPSSGAEIPFAITRSNRTDLINASEVRGHIGLTFDFGKLFGAK